ncbi:hypothetical protein PG988_001757 [Apiospora saccharicola]
MVNANEEARRNDAAALRRSGNIVLQSIQALGDVLLNGVKQIIQLNMFIHRDLQVSLLKLESRIETPISVEAFTFEDAIGRVAVMHLSSVDSWEAFDALLMVHFNGRRGFGRVTRKRYALQDVRRKREIRRSVPWRSAMLPGSQVSMSIICNVGYPYIIKPRGIPTIESCPRCFRTPLRPVREGKQCGYCNLFCTGIAEVQDTISKSPTTFTGSRNQKIGSGSCGQSTEAEESDDEDASEFTRVQLVAKPGDFTRQIYLQITDSCLAV